MVIEGITVKFVILTQTFITNALLENGGDLLIDTKIIMSDTDERVGPSSPNLRQF